MSRVWSRSLGIIMGIGVSVVALGIFPPGGTKPQPARVPQDSALATSNHDRRGIGETLHQPDKGSALRSHDDDVFSQFSGWVEDYIAEQSSARSAHGLAVGLNLAIERRAILKQLIETQPEAALAFSLPDPVRSQLPPAILRQLETVVADHGEYRVAVADDFDRNKSEVRREATIGGATYDAFVYGQRRLQTSAANLPLRGISIDRSLAIFDVDQPLGLEGSWAGDVGGGVEFGGLAASNRTQGTRTLLFMRVAFSDDPAEPISYAAANQLMSDANQWFTKHSYNSTSIIGDVSSLLILPEGKAYYAFQGINVLQTHARAAALTAGFDTANYDLDVVSNQFLGGATFNFAGFASVGSKGMILQIQSLDVFVHELGHNYGLWHANYWSASSDGVIGAGNTVEYGNPFDTMGTRHSNPDPYHFNAYFKHRLGWLPSPSVQTVTSSGLFRIHAYDIPKLTGGRNYALRIRKDDSRNYWAELRQNFSSNPWIQNGLLLNWSPWDNDVGDSLIGTTLLDSTPGTPTGNSSKDDSAVVIGRTFSDEAAGIHLTPTGKGMDGADPWIDVQVNLGAYPGNSAPTLQIAADQTAVAAAVPVNFSAMAADADGDPLVYYWEFGDLSFGANSLTSTKSWSNDGEYVVRCVVSDMKGGVASRNLLVTVGSPGTFRVSGQLTAAGLPLEGVHVHNGLSGSSYRGGYSDSDGSYVLANVEAGSHTLSAAKYGFSLASSGWSNPVSVGPNLTAHDWTATEAAIVSIVANDPVAAEAGADPGAVTLSRSGSTGSSLIVNLSFSGSATYAADYSISPTPTPGSPLQVTIPAGESSIELVLTPTSDASGEGPEAAVVSILENSSYTLGSLAEARVTIADGQPPVAPTLAISVPDSLATESASDSGVIRIAGSVNASADIEVHYMLGGSAINGIDYTPLSGVATIAAGSASTLVSFNSIDDLDVEGDETVTLTLISSTGYGVGTPADGTVTIADDDPVRVTLTTTDETAVENSGDTGRFTLTRLGSLDQDLVVHYSLAGSASNGSDYAVLPTTVIIPAGQSSASFTIVPSDDSQVEGSETVVATILSHPSYNIGSPGAALVYLIDDDSPAITLVSSDPSASELASSSGAFTFTRSGATVDPLEVFYSLSGSALNGIDYSTVGGSVVIPAGSSGALLEITPIDDAIKEGDEMVVVTLLDSPTASYSANTAATETLTIADDDSGNLVGVGFSASASSGLENQFLVGVTITLSAPSPVPILITCGITGGTAVVGEDYETDLPRNLFFPQGAVSQNLFIVGLIDNDTLDPIRTIVVSLSSPINAQLDGISDHTFTIYDEETAGGSVTVTAIDGTATELGSTPGMFRISRSGSTGNDLPVSFQVTGSAGSPSDYVAIGNSAVIPAGASSVDVVVSPVDDATPEPTETLTLTLTSASQAFVENPSGATILIEDNDLPATLIVTPHGPFVSAGQGGGPFAPSSADYTLRNSGHSPMDWGASANADWLDLATSSGTLAPGESTPVSVSINSQANALLPQSHTATVSFDNLTNGNGNASRDTLLNVQLAAPNLNSEPLFTGGNSNSIAWVAPIGAEFFEVQHSPSPSFPVGSTVSSSLLSASTTAYEIMGLVDNGTYHYRVRATRAAASPPESSWSDSVSSTQDASDPILRVTPGAGIVASSSVTIAGTASDTSSGIASVTIGGIPAISTDGFATWSADYTALTPAYNDLEITAADQAVPANLISANHNVYYATSAGDFDGDGLPDNWEFEHGLDLFDDGTVSTANGPLGDIDGDGLVNLLEFAVNNDPNVNDLLPMSVAIDPPDGDRYFTVTYNRRIDSSALAINAEVGDGLNTWETVGSGNSELLSVIPNLDGITESVTVRILPSLDDTSDGRFFARLAVMKL